MAETEFLKIADAKTALKGSFRGVIIKAGDLKSGTSNGKDWTKKIFTIQDDSGDTDLVAWGEEVATFKVGSKYEITNPWWKTYEGKVSVSVGNYGNAKVIGTATAEETAPPPQQKSLDTPKPDNLDEMTTNRVRDETILLKKMYDTVKLTLGAVDDDKERLLLFTQLIYQKYFGEAK